ncbi:hypothetical protein BCR34DRAFT_584229 [Clohesyomyces aquaticus]|uniref:Uncharacterized protein n=1 Tax=Clohesyomyces aquaticus TaxID=1231657 RepID=A0A1Y2A261_9PLEO|nr:hypothetical protein BCR34DRAFT_584229 [Clohesyomyces aquaticus]
MPSPHIDYGLITFLAKTRRSSWRHACLVPGTRLIGPSHVPLAQNVFDLQEPPPTSPQARAPSRRPCEWTSREPARCSGKAWSKFIQRKAVQQNRRVRGLDRLENVADEPGRGSAAPTASLRGLQPRKAGCTARDKAVRTQTEAYAGEQAPAVQGAADVDGATSAARRMPRGKKLRERRNAEETQSWPKQCLRLASD